MRIPTVLLFLIAAIEAQGSVIYEQAPLNSGLMVSSWLNPEGSDSDMYVYESFIPGSNQAITEVQWRGAYLYNAPYGKAWDFTITFYESTAGDTEPHVTNPQLEEFYLAFHDVGGNAGETSAGVYGGREFFDYSYVLPEAFLVEAGRKYWIRIQASQSGYPDWGIAAGSGPNSSHFRFSTGSAMFTFGSGDTAFKLLTLDGPPCNIQASASPPEGGTLTGMGIYPTGASVGLRATANPGFLFKRWKEGASVVSTNSHYVFTAAGNRTLSAVFDPAITITTEVSPPEGGSATGGGDFNDGDEVLLTATPNPGYTFLYWAEGGIPVHALPTYAFAASVNRTLTATFAPSAFTQWFDLDTGQPPLSTGQGIPLDQTVNGLTAHFDSPQGSAFSIQTDSSTQWHMSQFSGHYLYANNLNRNHLTVDFDSPLSEITLTFATADNHQTETPTNILLTAFDIQGGGGTIGTATTHATYGADTFPMGLITFSAPAGASFDKIDLYLPYQPQGATAFYADNFIATMAPPPTPTPTPTPTPIDDAAAVGDSIPPTIPPARLLNVAVTMWNTGETTWTLEGGYALAVIQDTCSMLPPSPVNLQSGEVVPPSRRVIFRTTVQSPPVEGICDVQIQMTRNADLFGGIQSHTTTVAIPPNAVEEWAEYD